MARCFVATWLLLFCTTGAEVIPIRQLEELSTVLPNADRNTFAAYNEDVDKDCIWVFGGYNYQDSFYCFNMTSTEIYSYYNLTNTAYTRSDGAFFINDTLYYFSASARIIEMDVLGKVETQLAYPGISGGTDACMAKYPYDRSNTLFYFITPTSGNGLDYNTFYYYNISSSSLTQGPSLSQNVSRFVPYCTTHDEYLYVLGGGSNKPIERINLIDYHNDPDNTDWELIDSIDYDNIYCDDNSQYTMSGTAYNANWKDWIFIAGTGNYVGMFNTVDLQLYCSKASFNNVNGRSHLSTAIAGVYPNEQFFTFGGFTGSANVDYIFRSNNLTDFTESPTFLPTSEPSDVPSTDPTRLPTLRPSNVPTATPTAFPSKMPSKMPTFLPTFEDTSNLEYDTELEILLLIEVYDANDIDSNTLLKKNIIYAMKQASLTVRYDLKELTDVGVELISIENYNVSNLDTTTTSSSSNNRESDDDTEWWQDESYYNQSYNGSVATKINMIVSMKTELKAERWYDDLEFVMTEYESNLKDYWNINSLQTRVDNVDFMYIDTTTTTTSSSIMTTGETTMSGNNNNNGGDTGNDASTSDNGGLFSLSGSIDDLETLYNYVILAIVVAALIVTLLAFIDAKIVRHNELLKGSTMIIVTMYLLDVVSDAFFVIQVLLAQSNILEFFIFLLALIFLIVPIFSNFLQLHNSIQGWVTDVDTKRIVQAWIQNHLRSLYAISILFGSSHTAVEICNSNLFNLTVFNMGLNRRQKAVFKNQRIYSTVLLENVPQLILQMVFSISTSNYSFITIFSGVFSLLSIILTVFEHISAKLLLATETVLIVKMDVKCREIASMNAKQFKKVQNLRSSIVEELAKVIDIDHHLIELLLPTHSKDGLALTFHIRSDASQSATVLQQIRKEVQNNYLADKFLEIWKRFNVTTRVKILNVETKEIKPDRNMDGDENDVAAVISMNSQWNAEESARMLTGLDTTMTTTNGTATTNGMTANASSSIYNNGANVEMTDIGGNGSINLPAMGQMQLVASHESFSQGNNGNGNRNLSNNEANLVNSMGNDNDELAHDDMYVVGNMEDLRTIGGPGNENQNNGEGNLKYQMSNNSVSEVYGAEGAQETRD